MPQIYPQIALAPSTSIVLHQLNSRIDTTPKKDPKWINIYKGRLQKPQSRNPSVKAQGGGEKMVSLTDDHTAR